MGMGSCFYPIAHGNNAAVCWEFAQYSTPTFSTDFDDGHGILFEIFTFVQALSTIQQSAGLTLLAIGGTNLMIV